METPETFGRKAYIRLKLQEKLKVVVFPKDLNHLLLLADQVKTEVNSVIMDPNSPYLKIGNLMDELEIHKWKLDSSHEHLFKSLKDLCVKAMEEINQIKY